MCLGVPGEVVKWLDRDPLFARALVRFDGVEREVQMACVPDVKEAEFVIVHAGIAIRAIEALEAERVLALLQRWVLDEDDTVG
jgi:hydrogenase expression/formation protein HypC